MAKSNPQKEKEEKKTPQQEEVNHSEEKEQRGILPEDIDFRRGWGVGDQS